MIKKTILTIGALILLAALLFMWFGHCVGGCYGTDSYLAGVWLVSSTMLFINSVILIFRKNIVSVVLTIAMAFVLAAIFYPFLY